MDKVVTRKRGDLLKVIDKGGPQPLHIDHDVWGRLVKLAASKQYEEKSKQGRYANFQRKKLGRTGSWGVNGVREKLREKFYWSPDPDEMELEVNPDKGYGGNIHRNGAMNF